MGHYDEQYEKRDKQENEMKVKADKARKDMMRIPTNTMINIMFKAHLDKLSDYDVICLRDVLSSQGKIYL